MQMRQLKNGIAQANIKITGSKMKKHGALQLRKMKMVIFKLH